VLFNVPHFQHGETVHLSPGPFGAAKYGGGGADCAQLRSRRFTDTHTVLQYSADAPGIPAAAITEDADHSADCRTRHADRSAAGMEARYSADVESANVIGELRGREKPDEVVVVAGHLDSWDVGAGATDDGGGCVVTWEALRIMKKLNLRPRRTVRVVLFTNEENGGRGGTGYRDQHHAELSKTAICWSQGGVFRPLGFGFTGNDAGRATVRAIATLLTGIAADQISPGGGGADIGPSVQEGRIPAMALEVDGSKYFLIHHTPADTIDKIDPVEMAKCAAAVAVMTYVIADLPQRLGE
jgi:carboxypeptidase Q